jgi:hypothetical protein
MVRQALTLSLALSVCGATLFMSGCVRRVVSITSEPSGATVWLNDREIGRTPCEAEFTYYGTYDVRLQLDGYEPLDTTGEAVAPIWDTIPLDLAAEAAPAKLESKNAWHYTLLPTSLDHAALLERAKELQARTSAMAPSDPPANSAAAE